LFFLAPFLFVTFLALRLFGGFRFGAPYRP